MLTAHARGDSRSLVDLYTQAADIANDVDAMCFFLTHAYVFALETGHESVPDLRQRLIDNQREE